MSGVMEPISDDPIERQKQIDGWFAIIEQFAPKPEGEPVPKQPREEGDE